MENTNLIPVTIEDQMRGSYLDYAMSVIIGRALPDVRDGLKPVHRRILFAMLSEGLLSNRKFSKCAGVVGEVLKKYHPHGDSSVYEALVRMAQTWNLRYPLIDGQGNFGSIDGDPAAAYRYTECRMKALAEELLADIDQDTVDLTPNFDDSTKEPVVLPSRVPVLLINGTEGIAVGMASKIPPHNLREVVQATLKVLENPDVELGELMQVLPGPDFPTGGVIYGSAPMQSIYRTGRGLLKIRAKVRNEVLKTGKRENDAIIVDEIPYQVNKARLVEKIAELVNEKRIIGISRLRDESDRRGMRIVIELKRDAIAEVVTNQLFKLTPLEKTFGVTMLAVVNGIPKVLSLKEMLGYFIDHRRIVITRRCRFELAKAKARLHILEGLLIALNNIDEVIEIIKGSDSTAQAKINLIQRFSLSEEQAQHILDMPLKRLTGLERKAIEDEHARLLSRVEELLKILSSSAEIDRIVGQELREISDRYGDERRTVIEEHGDDINLEDLIAEEDMVVSISHRGYAKRMSPSMYKTQRRGGKGVMATKKLSDDDGDFISGLFIASTHAYLLVFTTSGKLYWIKVYDLPEAARTARGRAIVNMLNLSSDERVSAVLPVREFVEGKYVVMVTRNGFIKRVDLMAFSNTRNGGIIAATLDDADELVGVLLTEGKSDIILTTKMGLSIRFSEDKVRAMGRTARGVRGIKLEDTDVVVAVDQVGSDILSEEKKEDNNTPALLTVCQNGFGKRTFISEYRSQGRGGKGVITIKTTERNGYVVGTALVNSEDQVMLITTAGKVIRTSVKGISLVGRNTAGVNLVTLEGDESVAAVARLAEEQEEDEEGV